MELYLIKHLLDKSLEEGRLYEFEGDEDSFDYCGCVLSYNSDTIQIRHYTRYGEDDGIHNLPYDKINRIIIDSDYLDSLQYLIEKQDEFKKTEKLHDFRLSSGGEGVLSILNDCVNNRSIIVTLNINSETYYGFIDEIISTSFIVFTEIYAAGRRTSTAVYKIEDIECININEKFARQLCFLYNWWHKK